MGLSILNNIPSLEAQNQLAITNSNLQNTLFQLSSGSKINSGADDPAGLSIADGLQANISALTQSAQNVTDGVGMLQTADGALSQVTTLLNRAVTLATEAGNAGLTTDQQAALQNEFTSITNEINQIGTNTTYNNTPVFTGSQMSVFLSDGSAIDAAKSARFRLTMPAPVCLRARLRHLRHGNPGPDRPTDGRQYRDKSAPRHTRLSLRVGATAANDVALGTTVQGTLQNLQAAVNGGAGAGTTYGTGTAVNTSATITNVNGGSATVQAIAAGMAGNTVALSASLTGAVGGVVGGNGDLSGGTAAADLSTAADAQTALVTIEGAIATVAADRGAIGSGINQMNAALDVMNNTSQNLSSSLSGIQDANMGQVVANMSKYQVLEQTGIAALAQSNSNEQAVLKLLQ